MYPSRLTAMKTSFAGRAIERGVTPPVGPIDDDAGARRDTDQDNGSGRGFDDWHGFCWDSWLSSGRHHRCRRGPDVLARYPPGQPRLPVCTVAAHIPPRGGPNNRGPGQHAGAFSREQVAEDRAACPCSLPHAQLLRRGNPQPRLDAVSDDCGRRCRRRFDHNG